MNAPLLSAAGASTPTHGFLDGLALDAHVRDCHRARGRAFALRCAAERLHEVLGPRFFTTVFGATLLMLLLAGCA